MNIMKLMKQATDMQRKMEILQAELAEREVQCSVGGDKVTATATCDLRIRRIRIAPEVVDPQDVEMLEDLVLAAVDGVLNTARETSGAEMAKLTEGLPLPPGMKLPFS